ncbi:cupin domain-containing protein, partial [Rhizobium mayense]|uniref:cupin domain-containing protein n=1 Tax=Rhizobium mayense TaxID=1312184 RepID=UPI00398C3357
MSELDWLSQLLQIITVTGQLEVRCAYGAPWRIMWNRAAPNEIPYHVVVRGRAIFEDPEARTRRELTSGDIVLLPHGAAHVLHDGSGQTPAPTQQRQSTAGWMLSENDSDGEQLDLLCGRLFISPPHDRLVRNYLPLDLVARTMDAPGEEGVASATGQLS